MKDKTKIILIIKVALLFHFLGGASVSRAEDGYQYPYADPYVATILGTPKELQPSLPEKIRTEILELTVFKDRPIPKIFWYSKKLLCSLAYQKKEAPLIFIIAGTGGDHNGPSIKLLEKAFYQAGFHVISLPSPTRLNFIVTASETGVPGNLADDCRDLYRAMELAREQIQGRVKITEFYLTGFSLGALEAAYISRLDENEKKFFFKKVLLINPPVDLYGSARKLDRMLEDNIPGGLNNLNVFFDEMMERFSAIYTTMGFLDFNEDFLYAVFNKPSTALQEMSAVIGLSFRFCASNMIFTSDVVTDYGLIKPKNRILSLDDSTTTYFKVAFRTSFGDYFEEMFYPFFKARDSGLTREALIEQSSIKSMDAYLKQAQKIALMTNEDDFLYNPGDLEYLREVFKTRAIIYPRGGHCGNIDYKDNVAAMINFFKE